MVLQLLLIGFVLESLFEFSSLPVIGLVATIMVLIAAREVTARQAKPFRGSWRYGIGAVAMFLSSCSVAVLALTVIVRPVPWFAPQYAIPLLGMLLGNTMNGLAVALDRLTQEAYAQRDVIETRLACGQTAAQAISDVRRSAIRAGMIPTINGMAVAGLVSLPGMMTGQILAGTPPGEAVRYQILIMFLIAAGVGFGTFGASWLGARRLFDARERLRLDRLF
jgi:putative ABC transport system permease protein